MSSKCSVILHTMLLVVPPNSLNIKYSKDTLVILREFNKGSEINVKKYKSFKNIQYKKHFVTFFLSRSRYIVRHFTTIHKL